MGNLEDFINKITCIDIIEGIAKLPNDSIVTVYRDGSRDNQVLTIGSTPKAETTEHEVTPRERPRETAGKTIKTKTACGTLYVTINEDEYGLCEVFAAIGKSGGCAYSQAEGISRLISLALRSGVSAKSVVKQLIGIRCKSSIWDNGKAVLSCADAIGNALNDYIENIGSIGVKTDLPKIRTDRITIVDTCPECEAPLEMSEGCAKCVSCGYSRCS